MGKGWRSNAPKLRGHRISDLSPDALRVYTKIRRLTEYCMQEDFAIEMFEYRLRYRYGHPKRVHYSWKTRLLQDLLERVAQRKVSTYRAEMELDNIKRMS